MKKFFSKDNFGILADRKLLIAIAAVIFVPILYAGMFLWAFWDPYEHLVDIPVAVVNEDQAYDFEGEELALGDELIDNLKDNREFDFHFVNKSVGYQGLHDEDYYILIEIPEDFSKNASTVMEDKPEQLELIYKPNESFNFLAAQIGETAMLQIEQALEEEITATYADAIFDKIDKASDGLVDASEASKEVNDGANDLKDGSEKLNDNLITLLRKTIEFDDGVNEAYNGSSDLSTGANTLSSGIYELYDNSNKLKDASHDLQSGANQLASGISEADAGIGELQANIPKLISGTDQVKGGLDELYTELPEQMSKEIGNGLNSAADGAFDLVDIKIDQVQIEIEKELADLGISNIDNLSNLISGKVIAEVDKLPDAIASDIMTVIKEQIDNATTIDITDQLDSEVMTLLAEEDVSDKTKIAITEAIKSTTSDQAIDMDFDQLELVISSSIHGIMEQTNYKEKITTVVETNVEPIEKELKAKQQAVNQKIDQDLKTYKNLASEKVSEATENLNKEIKSALNEPIGQLQAGLTAVNDGQKSLQTGVNQLASGTSELQTGSNSLASGQNDYVANMNKFTRSFAQANDGTQELVNGTDSLYEGMFALKDGSLQLNDASNRLADGSSEIYDGMGTLTDGTSEFNQEMQDAAAEAGDINPTSKTNEMIANPVNVKNEKINEVPNYGTGFAPYFLSLGLFVGALLLSIVYPLTEPSNVPKSGFNWFSRKFLGLFSIGVLQAIIAATILIVGLGLEVQNTPLFFLYAILTSLVFITLIQFLVTCFGDPGRFVAILILILQLTTSAGTFPLELIPKLLQPFNLLLPMTYSVAGFKAVISSGDFGVMWSNAGILLIFSIVSMLLTLSYFIIMHKRKFGSRVEATESTD